VSGVLRQTFESHLHEAELPLDHAERVLALGPHAGLLMFLLLDPSLGLALRQFGDVAGPPGDVPFKVVALHAAGRSPVARIGPHRFLLAVQQIGHVLHVRLVGRRGGDRVHQAAVGIHPDVGLHSEVPLVALLGLVHLRVTFTRTVLGGTGRGDDGRVHDAAALEHQALARQVGIDFLKEVIGQVIGLQQMAKVQDGCFIRDRLGQVQSREAAHARDLVQRLFHRRIAQGEPVLHQVYPKHRVQRIRPATTSGHRVVGLNQLEQRLPRHNQLHLLQEDLPAGLLPLACVLRIRETDLAHR
jgi:hypothetical protein